MLTYLLTGELERLSCLGSSADDETPLEDDPPIDDETHMEDELPLEGVCGSSADDGDNEDSADGLPLALKIPPARDDAVVTPVKFTLRERSSCWDDHEADEAPNEAPLQRALQRSRPFWETQEERKEKRRREPKLDSHQQRGLDSHQRSHMPSLPTTASRPANSHPSTTRFPPTSKTRYSPGPDLECDRTLSTSPACDQSSASPVISSTEYMDLECGHPPASPPHPARPSASSKITAGSLAKARCLSRCTCASPSAQHTPEQSAQQEAHAWSTARQEAQGWFAHGSCTALPFREMVIQWSKLRAPSITSPPEGPPKRRSVRDMPRTL